MNPRIAPIGGALNRAAWFWLLSLVLAIVAGCAGIEKRPGVLEAVGVLPAPPSDVAVMSFNIRYGTAKDGDNSWPNRRELVVNVIAAHQPDVLGLQEALRFQLDELRAALPEYAEVGVGRDDGRTQGEYSPVLYRRDRFSAVDGGTFWLSDTPEVAGSTTWGNRLPRICSWVRLRERSDPGRGIAGGRVLVVYNLHLDHESEPARRASAELLARRIDADVRPDEFVIVTGDFNCGEQSPAIRFLRGEITSVVNPEASTMAVPGWVGLADTYRQLHAIDAANAASVGTFHGFNGTRDGDKIDFVFVRPASRGRAADRPPTAEVLSAAIDRTNDNGRWPSDHYPVIATIRLRN